MYSTALTAAPHVLLFRDTEPNEHTAFNRAITVVRPPPQVAVGQRTGHRQAACSGLAPSGSARRNGRAVQKLDNSAKTAMFQSALIVIKPEP